MNRTETRPSDPRTARSESKRTSAELDALDGPITKNQLRPLPPVVTWAERYVLGPLLGEGGTSRVHEAFDLRLGRVVAVKQLHGRALPAVTLLESEARAL